MHIVNKSMQAIYISVYVKNMLYSMCKTQISKDIKQVFIVDIILAEAYTMYEYICAIVHNCSWILSRVLNIEKLCVYSIKWQRATECWCFIQDTQ
jgi:hypothetical protein